MSDGDHFFQCLLPLCIPGLVKCPFKSSHFTIGLLRLFFFFFFFFLCWLVAVVELVNLKPNPTWALGPGYSDCKLCTEGGTKVILW